MWRDLYRVLFDGNVAGILLTKADGRIVILTIEPTPWDLAKIRNSTPVAATMPARGCLFADEMELTRDDMPARKQAYCFSRAYAAAGS